MVIVSPPENIEDDRVHIGEHNPDLPRISDMMLAKLFGLNRWWDQQFGWNNPPQIILATPKAQAMVILPYRAWVAADMRPVPILDDIAQSAEEIRCQLDLTDPVTACLLINEVWSFDNTGATPEQIAERVKVAAAGRVYMHPDREEARMLLCVDWRGRAAGLVYYRDSGKVLIEHNGFDGALLDSMAGICPAFNKGIAVPDNPEDDPEDEVSIENASQLNIPPDLIPPKLQRLADPVAAGMAPPR